MSVELRVPVLPESVTDGLVSTWHKQEGDYVKRDEILVDIETDKVVFEVPAISDGVLTKILKKEGETVNSEEALATIDSEQKAGAASADKSAATPASQASKAIILTPAVRNLVAEHELDPAMINGSGKGGRILKADVLQYIEQQQTTTATAEKNPPPVATSATTPAIRREPMSRLRAKIAERMVEVQHNAAILSTFNEVNMQAVMAMRKRYQETFQKKHGIKLGVMSFFVRAVCEALKRFPIVNASVEDNDILYHDYYDVSIAVSSPRGLVVPVIRNADSLGFAGIEHAIADFALRAKEGNLNLDELLGGTFTITNGGVFGSMLSTPLLNPPQSAILGMHNIQQRAVVEGGEIVIRPMMYLAVSYDHRIIDGRDAVQFLVNIKQSLEEPHRLLLDI